MAPVVVFLLVAALIAGSLSWPVVAGVLFGLALLAHALPALGKSPEE